MAVVMWQSNPLHPLRRNDFQLVKGSIVRVDAASRQVRSIEDPQQLQALQEQARRVRLVLAGSAPSSYDLEDNVIYSIVLDGIVDGNYQNVLHLTLDSRGFLYTSHLRYHMLHDADWFAVIEDLCQT